MSGEAAERAYILSRIERLEAESAIRMIMADYMRLCDRLTPDTPMYELGDLFSLDATWAGRGERYGATFGTHEGREAILAMLDRYRDPPHFALNVHFLTSEAIAVHGETATGGWVMLQTSSYQTGTSDLRAARLHISFVRQPDRWRICRFETESLFSRPIDRWDDPAPVRVPIHSGD